MEIILLETLNKLGKAGEIVNVKDGYAKNYLIPSKKALIANKENKADLNIKMSAINKNNEDKINEAKKIKSNLEGKEINIELEANEDGNLYGTINQKAVLNEISRKFSIELHTDNLIISQIKTLGNHEIKIRLYDEISCSMQLSVSKKN